MVALDEPRANLDGTIKFHSVMDSFATEFELGTTVQSLRLGTVIDNLDPGASLHYKYLLSR